MKSQRIDGYIVFGTQLRYLMDAGEGWSAHPDDMILDNIQRFIQNLDRFEMPVTARAARRLGTFADTLRGHPKDYRLTDADAAELSEIMSELRPTLYAEAEGNIAYVVSDKRYDVKKLLSDFGALLAPGVFARLPEIARTDLQEAGMCIAFTRPTAAAFHLLRATEAVLRQYYCGVVRQGRIARPWMWGPMMDDMRGRRHAPDATLTHNLDGLRQHFRNPTQHPE
jgi:hypothetical protein